MIDYLDRRFMDFDAIIDHLEILKFDMNLLASSYDTLCYQLYTIPFVMLSRKPVEYMSGRDLNDPGVIAQVIIDAYPKKSLNVIKKKADYALTIKYPVECQKTKQSKARDCLLAYADCINFK